MDIEIWVRNSFEVEAVRVTEENLRQVANWTGGDCGRTLSHHPRNYVLVDTVEYNRLRQTKVFVGDWVIRIEGQFKHYRNDSLRLAYHKKPEDVIPKLRELVQQALIVDLKDSEVSYEELTGFFTERFVSIIEGWENE
jgi:hypothetical protein